MQTEPAGTFPGQNSSGLAAGGLADRPAPARARQMLKDQPASRPAPGTAVVTDKGLSGQETEAFFCSDDLAWP